MLTLASLTGCENANRGDPSPLKQKNDLNSLKEDFLSSTFKGNIEDSPYDMHYALKTVFFSPNLISLLSDTDIYDASGEPKEFFEGKTYYKNNDKFEEVKISDIFTTETQKEFLNNYLEKIVQDSGGNICKPIGENYSASPLINEKALIIILQPTEKCNDRAHFVAIPYNQLKNEWNPSSTLARLLPQILNSKSYNVSWDEEEFIVEGMSKNSSEES